MIKMHFRRLWQIRYAAWTRQSINLQWLVEHALTRKKIFASNEKREKKWMLIIMEQGLVKQRRVSLTTAQLLHFDSPTSQYVRRMQFFKPHSTHLIKWKFVIKLKIKLKNYLAPNYPFWVPYLNYYLQTYLHK